MYPVIFKLFGKVPIHGYGLMIVIGFLLASWIAARETRRQGLPDVMYDFGVVMLLAGVLGGRVFYFVQFYGEKFADKPWWEFFKIWQGGLVFYGGAVGGFVGGVAYLWFRKLRCWKELLDISSVVVPIGMAFGRLGCFLNGCCFGRRCEADFGLGVEFPDEAAANAHHLHQGWVVVGSERLPVHPVQLYQAAHDFLLFLLLWWFVRGGRAPRGAGMPTLWLLYAVGRFALEDVRGDHTSTFSGLTVSQNVSIATASVFGLSLIFLYGRHLGVFRAGRQKLRNAG